MTNWRYWLPCLGTFLVQMTIFGIHNNFGLIYHHLILEFNASAAETAWIGSFAMGVTFLLSPLANLILSSIGFNYTMVLSTALSVTSLVLSSFVNNVHLLSLTYSIMWGCGSALANHASFVTIQETYRGKLSLANGIASSGTGIGTLAVGPYLGYVLQKYQFRWAFRICAVTPLCFLLAIAFTKLFEKSTSESNVKTVVSDVKDEKAFTCAENRAYDPDYNETVIKIQSALENSVDHHDSTIDENKTSSNENDKTSASSLLQSIFNKELWTIKSYALFTIGVSVFLFGYFIPFVFLVTQATKHGIEEQKAQFLISILSIISTITKIFCGYWLDKQKRFRISTIVVIAMYSMSLSHIIPGFATEYWHFVAFSILFGICEGCFVGQLCAVITDSVPKTELVGTGISNLYALMSLSLMLGPVVAGKLATILHHLRVSFFVATGISLCGTVIATFSKVFEPEKIPLDVESEVPEKPSSNMV